MKTTIFDHTDKFNVITFNTINTKQHCVLCRLVIMTITIIIIISIAILLAE